MCRHCVAILTVETYCRDDLSRHASGSQHTMLEYKSTPRPYRSLPGYNQLASPIRRCPGVVAFTCQCTLVMMCVGHALMRELRCTVHIHNNPPHVQYSLQSSIVKSRPTSQQTHIPTLKSTDVHSSPRMQYR